MVSGRRSEAVGVVRGGAAVPGWLGGRRLAGGGLVGAQVRGLGLVRCLGGCGSEALGFGLAGGGFLARARGGRRRRLGGSGLFRVWRRAGGEGPAVGGVGLRLHLSGWVGVYVVGGCRSEAVGSSVRRGAVSPGWLGGGRPAGCIPIRPLAGAGRFAVRAGGVRLASQSGSEFLGLPARRGVAPLRRLGGCCAAGSGPASRAAGAGEGRGW